VTRDVDDPSDAPQHQTCPSCKGERVKRATLTWMMVYVRCEDCGYVWSFSERRKRGRSLEDKRF